MCGPHPLTALKANPMALALAPSCPLMLGNNGAKGLTMAPKLQAGQQWGRNAGSPGSLGRTARWGQGQRGARRHRGLAADCPSWRLSSPVRG